MSVNDIDPSLLFGGTWERIKDKFLLCSGDTYTLGSEGGEATHKLTTSEMPSHNHMTTTYPKNSGGANGYDGYGVIGYYGSRGNSQDYYLTGADANGTWLNSSGSTGGNTAHNNMPPYLTVNVWMRVNPTQ